MHDRKPNILFWTQIALMLFLVLVIFLVLVFEEGHQLVFYLLLIFTLFILLAVAFFQNIYGKYKRSAILTVLAVVIGPWGSIFLDPSVFQGDILPLFYITLSIQLCAILLSVRLTVVIAVIQYFMLLGCIVLNPPLQAINWPSLLSYIVMTSVISVLASMLNRKQIEEIEEQKEHLRQNANQLQEAAVRDTLTGLYNRRYMADIIQAEINRATRQRQPISLMMVDIDNFKDINDSYGHVFGDYILSTVAGIFSKSMRNFDLVCRYGGDEFVIMLPGSAMENTRERADVLRRLIQDYTFALDGQTAAVTISVGISEYPACAQTEEDLLKAADRALYSAKRNGRNTVVAAHS